MCVIVRKDGEIKSIEIFDAEGLERYHVALEICSFSSSPKCFFLFT